MQIYADVTGRPFRVSASDQTPALGSAMFGAVAAGPAAGGYATIEDAARAMARLRDEVYRADPGEPGDLRRAVSRVRPAARLLRPRRERRDEDPRRLRASRGRARTAAAAPEHAARRRSGEQLVELHAELPRHGLVAWTGGNVSARDPETGLVAIKPSGVRYEDLTAESMVVVDLDGTVVEGRRKPSSDTASHLYIYRHRPDVNGVVHTHSRYATAFAAVGRPIPVFLTAQADEFGGEIPCAGFALIGDEAIGAQVVESIGRSPAVLLKNHGVFTVGPTAAAAVKAAVMTEDVAATRLGRAPARRPGRAPGRPRRRAPPPLHQGVRPMTSAMPRSPVHRPPTTRSGSSPAASTCTARRRSRRSPSTPRRSPPRWTPRRRSRSRSSSSRS